MGTNETHPYVRRVQQYRKKLMRSCKKEKIPHHNRKWWKAWTKTLEASRRKAFFGTERGEQDSENNTEFILPDDSWDEVWDEVAEQLKKGGKNEN